MRKFIAGGLLAAGAIGAGVGGCHYGESLNDNPEGSHIDEEQAMEAAYTGYIALSGENECGAIVLSALSTLDDEWYEPPKSKGKTYEALVQACPEADSKNQEALAEEASTYFGKEVAPATSRYEQALDHEVYDYEERFIFFYAPLSIVALGGVFIGGAISKKLYDRVV